MIEISALLALADAYMVAAAVPETTVSHRLFADTKKLAMLRAGSDIQVGRFNQAIRWFSDNWPEKAVWPHDLIARPHALEPGAAA